VLQSERRKGKDKCDKIYRAVKRTGHVEAVLPLLDILPAARTRLRILRDPVPRLPKLRVAVLAHAVKLLTRLALVPRHRVAVAHLKGTLFADDVLIRFLFVEELVDLPAGAALAEAPPEIGQLAQRVEVEVVVVPVCSTSRLVWAAREILAGRRRWI